MATKKADIKAARDHSLVKEAEALARLDVHEWAAERDPFDERDDWRDAIRLDDPEDFDWEPEAPATQPRKYAHVEPTSYRHVARERRRAAERRAA